MTLAFTPRPRPARQPMEGRHARLEPLDAARHGDDLWQALDGHDRIWDYLPYGPFPDRAAFLGWLGERQALADPLYFAVIDQHSGKAVGLVTLMEIRPQHGVIETGHIVFSPALQRTPAATEAIYLQARHAFDDLGYRRFEWKCNNENAASRRAAERFGFIPEGVFRQHMVVKGRNRDTAWFSITDGEWPSVKAAFEGWLAPENFGPDGRQRRRLSDFR